MTLVDEPDYHKIILRIKDTLQNDDDLSKEISQFRYGDDPKEFYADVTPLIYVTTAATPESYRDNIAPANSINVLPVQRIAAEFWVIILVTGPTQYDAQEKAYDLRNKVISILERNIQLRDSEGEDPLCAKMDISSIRRMADNTGEILEGMTVMIRTIHVKKSPSSSV